MRGMVYGKAYPKLSEMLHELISREKTSTINYKINKISVRKINEADSRTDRFENIADYKMRLWPRLWKFVLK